MTQGGSPDARALLVLGVETSCDDTAAAVVRRNADGSYLVLSSEIDTRPSDHAQYGGVVPEIAARSHVERISDIIRQALEKSGHTAADLDGVAATAGPGLIGGVMVGLTAAKGLAMRIGKPLVPVNHLEGHALSVRLTDDAEFPYLLLLVSGGHTQLIEVCGLGEYRRLGTTIDDAAGEAFDKTAKLLGLGHPGGPNVERAATGGRADKYDLPRPLLGRDGCDFSFSGLKTAVRVAAEALATPTGQDIADLAASFQAAAARHLAERTEKAMAAFEAAHPTRLLVVAGGVAANCAVKGALDRACRARGWRLLVPPAKYCTDNGAMIALAGAERLATGVAPSEQVALATAPLARWPLAPPPPGRAQGGGRKGPKA